MTGFKLSAERLLSGIIRDTRQPLDSIRQTYGKVVNDVGQRFNVVALGEDLGCTPEWAAELLLRQIMHGTVGTHPSVPETGRHDNRHCEWRVRVMLFDPKDECQAATEPERYDAIQANMTYDDAYGPSTEAPILRGLTPVCSYIARSALEFHGTLPMELSARELMKKMPGIRPTLSRMKGTATLRVDYLVAGQQWTMRAEIRRAELAIAPPAKREFEPGNGLRIKRDPSTNP